MTPIMQQFFHDPPRSYGDCHRAALASLLDLSIDDVPHFMDGLGPSDGEVFHRREDDFLHSLGLDAIQIPVIAPDLETVIAAVASWNPTHDLFLLGGESSSGCGHTVVAGHNGVVHDPSPRNVGIVGPMSDGAYWITYIVGKRAAGRLLDGIEHSEMPA